MKNYETGEHNKNFKEDFETLKEFYRHLISGKLLKLIKKRRSEASTYVECDERGHPEVKKREWSITGKKEQYRLVKGFKNLEKLYI